MQLTDNIASKLLDPSSGFFFASTKEVFLHLQNGMVFSGIAPADQEDSQWFEVVFNTGMTGYDASLTDPSYSGQILAFTYPLIGNYGVSPKEDWESEKIHAAGVVVSEACFQWSHGKNCGSLLEWLQAQRVPVIMGVDTRSLTKVLREAGTMPGLLSSSNEAPISSQNTHLITTRPARASVSQRIIYGNHPKKIIAVDCGMKANILRNLQKHSVSIHRTPYDEDYSSEDFDGIFLSNGPGDPEMYSETISILRKAMKRGKPIFGICLGAQLLALAAGARTYKLKYGHRGHNQPCINEETGRCHMTSQNHGYAVDEQSLPEEWLVSYRNLNDHTVEGIRHRSLPFSAVQFHPEAAPGPTDTEWMFKQFIESL